MAKDSNISDIDRAGEPQVSFGHPVSRWPKILIALISLVIVAGVVVWLVFFKSSGPTGSQAYKYTYQRLQPYTLFNSLSGNRISMQLPPEFKQISRLDYSKAFDSFSTADFDQVENSLAIGSLSMASSNYQASNIDSIRSALAKPSSDSDYQSHITEMSKFLGTDTPSRFSLSLSQAQPFANSYIKGDAWQFDFTFTDVKAVAAHDKSNIDVWKGKVLYLLGKSSYYYIAFGGVDYNWQSNQATWQDMLNSLRIDQ